MELLTRAGRNAAWKLLTPQERQVLRNIATQNQTDAEVKAVLGDAPISENLAALIEREPPHDGAFVDGKWVPGDRKRWDLAKAVKTRVPVLLDENRE